jgi:hypothetical protein
VLCHFVFKFRIAEVISSKVISPFRVIFILFVCLIVKSLVKHEHRPLSIKFERFVVIATPFTDRHNITEILLNAALNTIKQTNKINITLNGEITLEEITSAIRNLKTKGKNHRSVTSH